MNRSLRIVVIVLAAGGILTGLVGIVADAPVVLIAAGVLLVLATLTALAAAPSPRPDPSPEPARPHPERRAPASSAPGDVLAMFAAAAGAAGEVTGAHLWLHDEPTHTLRLVAATGAMRPSPEPVSPEDPILGQALERGHAIVAPWGASGDPSSPRTVWRYAVPLNTEEMAGVVALDFLGEEPDTDVLTGVTADLRVTLSSGLALVVARRRVEAAGVLVRAARELATLIDSTTIAQALLRHAVELTGANTGSVMLTAEDGSLTIRAAKGLADDIVAETRLRPGEGIAGWVLASAEPFIVEDVEGRRPHARRHGICSAVSVPIGDPTGVVGVLNVGSRSFGSKFSPALLTTLETLGTLAVAALRNAHALESSRDLYLDTLRTLAVAMETKDPYASGATDRVVDLAMSVGRVAGLQGDELEALHIAALLHDVGMSAAGDVVTTGDRPLSTVEWGMLKMHPIIAADVVSQAPALKASVPIVYHHHERYDGTGYVTGMSGESIPLGARVLAVVDAFVAMTSDRPYRRALSVASAIDEVQAGAGTQFDPAVVAALVRVVGSSHDARSLG